MDEITKQATSEIMKTGNGVFAKLFGPAAEQVGLMIAAPLKERFLKNQFKALTRLKEDCAKDNISIKQVDLKILYPFLEGVAVEEDENLQQLWSNLMVNYMDTKKNLTITVYPEILKQLSKHDAELLRKSFYNMRAIYENRVKDMVTLPQEDLPNLVRIGLLRERTPVNLPNGSLAAALDAFFPIYEISPFGIDFYLACQRN